MHNSESSIIKLIRELTQDSKTDYLGDDCAVIDINSEKLLVSSDAMIEDVHFRSDMPAHALGWKIVAVNISDIAAMGGVPKYFSLTMSGRRDHEWLREFLRGLMDCLNEYGVKLIGGDTTGGERLALSGHIIGEAGNYIAQRNQAKPGDKIVVVGSVGLSSCEFETDEFAGGHHYYPKPQVQPAIELINKYNCHCMMDISDGLLDCMRQVSEQSGVGMRVEIGQLLQHPVTAKNVLVGGEDYSVFAAVPSEHADQLSDDYIVIGEVISSEQSIEIYDGDQLLDISKYQEFKHFEN